MSAFIKDNTVQPALLNLLEQYRRPVWDADDEDGQWCIPEQNVIDIIGKITEQNEVMKGGNKDDTSTGKKPITTVLL